MQRALEREAVVRTCGLGAPVAQRMLGGVDELGGFIGEDRGDFGIEVGGLVGGGNSALPCGGARVRRAGRCRSRRCGDTLVELLVGPRDPFEQLPVTDEIARGLIEVGRHRFHRAHAVTEQCEVCSAYPQAAAIGTPQPVIERLGEPDAVAGLRHL